MLSRLESGQYPLVASEVPVAGLVSQTLEALGFSARRQGIELTVAVSDDVGSIPGDADQLERVMLNLVGNAVKFTPPGGKVESTSTATATGCRITVSDTGIGIPADEHHRLFESVLPLVEREGRRDRRHGPRTVDREAGGRGARRPRVHRVVPGAGTTVTVELPGPMPHDTEREGTTCNRC